MSEIIGGRMVAAFLYFLVTPVKAVFALWGFEYRR